MAVCAPTQFLKVALYDAIKKCSETWDHLVSATFLYFCSLVETPAWQNHPSVFCFVWNQQSRCGFLWNLGSAFVSEAWSVVFIIIVIIVIDQIFSGVIRTRASQTPVTHSLLCHFSASCLFVQDYWRRHPFCTASTFAETWSRFLVISEIAVKKYLVIHLNHVSTLFHSSVQELAVIGAQVVTSCKHLCTLCFAVE